MIANHAQPCPTMSSTIKIFQAFPRGVATRLANLKIHFSRTGCQINFSTRFIEFGRTPTPPPPTPPNSIVMVSLVIGVFVFLLTLNRLIGTIMPNNLTYQQLYYNILLFATLINRILSKYKGFAYAKGKCCCKVGVLTAIHRRNRAITGSPGETAKCRENPANPGRVGKSVQRYASQIADSAFLFCIGVMAKKGRAEVAFFDVCRTSSGLSPFLFLFGKESGRSWLEVTCGKVLPRVRPQFTSSVPACICHAALFASGMIRKLCLIKSRCVCAPHQYPP